ncbi:MAG TPA: SDR family NAD(P)-dependent oxidoreductase [Terriglobia bacterium]|nr:SDR family NAD(P)-dependent oxidoreductase [Terriglobia bacterium]
MPKLKDKVVVVTGGSRGIGLAIARACAGEGARVAMVGRDRKALTRAARQIAGDVQTIAADITQPKQVGRVFGRIGKRFGRIDVLVNNAGVFTYKAFARTTLADWRRNIETNLTAVFLTTQAALPLLARSRGPHLINILSISSREAFPKCSAYTASKFGALGLTRVLRQELRELGIRVTAVLPGATNTRLMDEFDFPVHRDQVIQPEDVAGVVLAALMTPARTTQEEIVLAPTRGSL